MEGSVVCDLKQQTSGRSPLRPLQSMVCFLRGNVMNFVTSAAYSSMGLDQIKDFLYGLQDLETYDIYRVTIIYDLLLII